MARQLPPTDHFHYVPVEMADACSVLTRRLAEPEIYEVALCLGFIPTADEFAQMLQAGEIDLWQVNRLQDAQPVAYAIDSHRFADHELYVHCLDGWDNTVVAEVLGALGAAVFAKDSSTEWVYTAVSLPLPAGSEETLYSLGYDLIPSATDRGLKSTFGLDRAVHEIYTVD